LVFSKRGLKTAVIYFSPRHLPNQSLGRGNPLAKPELGTKRQCQSCASKFYDLQKDPILCPKCGTVFQPAALSARAEMVAKAVDDDEADAGSLTDGPELVSLDEVDAEESGKDIVIPDVDVEIEDDDIADEAFLEEEEEGDDDVADLIDGDLENDEEV
jgi:uncharacterized protein (TIGR02300 family)